MRRLSVAVLLLVAFAARADEPQLEFRSVLMFNQHLYYGSFAQPHGIAIDEKHKEIWVADTGNNLVGVFRPDGAELFAFASKAALVQPVRIAVAPNGNIAVIEGDRTHVRLFDYRGERLHDVQLDALGAKPIIGAIAYDGSGKFYVGDNRTSQVFVFERDGKLRQQFGSRGTDEGQFQSICSIDVAADGTIFVLDQQALAVQEFDDQGNFIRGWGKHEMGGQHFSLPSGLAVHGDYVFVSDELRHQVKVFDKSGKFLTNFGGLGDGAGQLAFPTDVAVDAKGRIYVTERSTSRVQVFEMRENSQQGGEISPTH